VPVILFCLGAAFFFLLAFLDRSPDRAPARRRRVVLAGLAWFVLCLALAVIGSLKS
jgi:quinol-cytochrome oxidoreductase complex cytochrome b subunit